MAKAKERKKGRLPGWLLPAFITSIIFLLLEQAINSFKDLQCKVGICSILSFSFGVFAMFFIFIILDYYGVI